MHFMVIFSQVDISPEHRMRRGIVLSTGGGDVLRQNSLGCFASRERELVLASHCAARFIPPSLRPHLHPSSQGSLPVSAFRPALSPLLRSPLPVPPSRARAPEGQRAVTRPRGRCYQRPPVTGTLTKSLLSSCTVIEFPSFSR